METAAGAVRILALFGAHDRAPGSSRNRRWRAAFDRHTATFRVQPRAARSTGHEDYSNIFVVQSGDGYRQGTSLDGDVRVAFYSYGNGHARDTLSGGPSTEIGVWEGSANNWTTFSFNFDHPRIATRSIRLLMEFADTSEQKVGAAVSLDDVWRGSSGRRRG